MYGGRVRGGHLCVGSSTERVCRGVWGVGTPPSVGRIYMPCRGRELPDTPALIYLDGGECVVDAASTVRASGVVMTPGAVSPELLELLVRAGVPYIILRERLPRELDGRVALLDTKRDLVIISPAAETLALYSVGSDEPRPSPVCYSSDRSRAMLRASRIDGEDVETCLTETVEGLCGLPLTVCIDLPHGEEESESFGERVEAILRAAVYGSLSVQIEGFASASDITAAHVAIAQARHRLERMGREAGSLLGWGLGIREPMWLMGGLPSSGDFVCYDLDRLNRAMAGGESGEAMPEGVLLDAWERYFYKRPAERRIFVRGREHPLLDAWCRLANVSPEHRFIEL